MAVSEPLLSVEGLEVQFWTDRGTTLYNLLNGFMRELQLNGYQEIKTPLLYNKGLTPRAIGHGEIVCTFTGRRSRVCNGTYFLPRGKIVVAGALVYRQFYEFAVLGGTRLYNNVQGSLTVTRTRPRRDILTFRLVV